jgi:hypothetical protein
MKEVMPADFPYRSWDAENFSHKEKFRALHDPQIKATP